MKTHVKICVIQHNTRRSRQQNKARKIKEIWNRKEEIKLPLFAGDICSTDFPSTKKVSWPTSKGTR